MDVSYERGTSVVLPATIVTTATAPLLKSLREGGVPPPPPPTAPGTVTVMRKACAEGRESADSTEACSQPCGAALGSGFRVQGSGFRIQGSGFRIQGSGFRVQGSGARVQGSRFTVHGLRCSLFAGAADAEHVARSTAQTFCCPGYPRVT